MEKETYKRKTITLHGVELILIQFEDETWFPLNSTFRYYLLRGMPKVNGYEKYIKEFDVKYTERQPTKRTIYISEIALISILYKTNFEKLKIVSFNDDLHRYLGIMEIDIHKKSNKKDNKSKKRMRWNNKRVIEEIKKRYKKGFSLNSTVLYDEDRSLFDAARKYYGTLENAITSSGFNYTDFLEDFDTSMYYGREFEKLVGEILTEIHEYVTKGYNYYIKPDFRITDRVWADAKLSQWTMSIPETMEKYEPYCDELIIIFLRGNKKTDKRISEKTRLVSVYRYIRQLLSQDRLRYYKPMLDKMYEDANRVDQGVSQVNVKGQ